MEKRIINTLPTVLGWITHQIMYTSVHNDHCSFCLHSIITQWVDYHGFHFQYLIVWEKHEAIQSYTWIPIAIQTSNYYGLPKSLQSTKTPTCNVLSVILNIIQHVDKMIIHDVYQTLWSFCSFPNNYEQVAVNSKRSYAPLLREIITSSYQQGYLPTGIPLHCQDTSLLLQFVCLSREIKHMHICTFISKIVEITYITHKIQLFIMKDWASIWVKAEQWGLS